MAWYDFFGRDRAKEGERTRDGLRNVGSNTNKGQPYVIFTPKSYDDVSKIIDVLRSGTPAIVHLNALKTETAIRVLDMLSGAIYALDGGVYEPEKNMFIFSPSGMVVNN